MALLNTLVITDSKTEAGIRSVPIHSELEGLMKQLMATSKDGHLLSGLKFNKYDDRSNAIGKRFGRLKTALGFPQSKVFHSIRKTVVTLLEDAGVSERALLLTLLGTSSLALPMGCTPGDTH